MGSIFRYISNQNTDFFGRQYKDATDVFDGYSKATTKSMTCRPRAKGKKGSTVSFALEMCPTISKENFLPDS